MLSLRQLIRASCSGVFLVALICQMSAINDKAFGCDGGYEKGRAAESLTLNEARQYMLALINRDRASVGCGPVELDEVSTQAAQAHSDDMARHGYLSHWDLQGKKPDQRYCEAGGRGAVFENVYTNHNNPYLGLDNRLMDEPLFPRAEIEAAEAWFFNQEAPADAHLRNIVDVHHRRVGIGISLATDKKFGSRITVAQEFVNLASDAMDMPSELAVGQATRLHGRLERGISLHAIQICREDMPIPLGLSELRKTSSYAIPQEAVVSYFPFPTRTAPPVQVGRSDDKEEFLLSFSPQAGWQAGLYYIVVWARDRDKQGPFIAAIHTLQLAKKPQLEHLASMR